MKKSLKKILLEGSMSGLKKGPTGGQTAKQQNLIKESLIETDELGMFLDNPEVRELVEQLAQAVAQDVERKEMPDDSSEGPQSAESLYISVYNDLVTWVEGWEKESLESLS